MKHIACILGVASALLASGCARASGSGSAETASSSRPAARSGETADAAGAHRQRPDPPRSSPAPAPQARDACALVTAKEITDVTGLAIERVEKTSNGCRWYASADALRQAGADSARSTFAQLNKEEPKSADAGIGAMESLLKGIRGAASPDKPLFEVIVSWDDADAGEAMLKGTIGAIGGGMPGGSLEPIDGLGERAFYGAMGAVFFARKGPALIQFGLGIGNREQAIALARKAVGRL